MSQRRIEDVPLADIEKNPSRHFETYALQSLKIEELKQSIKETGFWENIVGRRRQDGKVEIAYGHHRIRAAKLLGLETVPIIIKDLSDDLMRQMMIRENREQWGCIPAAIDDAVQAAREFLESNREEAMKFLKEVRPIVKRVRVGAPAIAKYTGFSETAVDLSLQRLGMIERGEVDRDALYKMPHQEAAKRFALQILTQGKTAPLTSEQQIFLADRIVEKGQFGAGGINLVFMEYHPVGKPSADPLHPNFFEPRLRRATRLGFQVINALRPFVKLNEYKTRVFEQMPTKEDISKRAKDEFLRMLPHLAEAVQMVCEKLDKEPPPLEAGPFSRILSNVDHDLPNKEVATPDTSDN